jgi:hypothetical protein
MDEHQSLWQGNVGLAQVMVMVMVMEAGNLVSKLLGQLLLSHGVSLCFFGENKLTRTSGWLLPMSPGHCT